jgi:RecA-family ATPase
MSRPESFEPDLTELQKQGDALAQYGGDNVTPPLEFIRAADWHLQPIPRRQWAVENRIPLRNVTLLSGEGAIGKSIVLMQLGVAHALGRDWLGTLPEPGPVIYVNCEDEADELHHRTADITAHYNTVYGDTLADLRDLSILSLAGKDAVLGYPDRNGVVRGTPLFDQLREAANDIKPRLIGLDTSADIYAGDENNRAQVRQFVGLLRNLAISANTAVVVCSHPSLTGINSGTGLSGSTAWHNSVRARAYMHAAITEKGDEPDRDLRVIDWMKSNYGPISETITVRWKNGVFLPEAAPGSLNAVAREHKADELFLALLTRLNARGENISPRRTANMYAPTVLAKEPEAKAASLKKKDFEASMGRLFTADKVHLDRYGRPSRDTWKLVPGPKVAA